MVTIICLIAVAVALLIREYRSHERLLAAIDDRPRVVISHSYGGNLGPARGESGPDTGGQTLHGCHLIPGITQLLWQEDWSFSSEVVVIEGGVRALARCAHLARVSAAR